MHTQTFDSGVARTRIADYLVASGYWGDESLRRRHAYVLSPAVYMLSPEQEQSLSRLARYAYNAVKTLNGRLVHLATSGTHLSHDEARFVGLANAGSRSLYTPADGVTDIPPVLKVDLVQDAQGRFFIAEVDSYNPRGFGFAALLEESMPELSLMRYPGMKGFAEHMSSTQEWCVVVSEFERYYEAPFRVLCNSLERHGKKMTILREHELGTGGQIPEGAGVLAIPESLNRYPVVREKLLAHHRQGTCAFLYPPVAYLGSKAFLPYLRSCIGMDEFIPPTVPVGKRHANTLPRPDVPAVLKATVSSGMKGVYFSDIDGDGYTSALAKASALKHSSWILQEQVPQEALPIVVFEEDGTRVVRDYFLRITAYVRADGVVDAEITGRPDRKVHGAPDCIQIPVILNRDST
ncbi:MAG TPA: hypothetical protein VHC20_02040 [Candidatus Paceibacterota bacterium]|nr:hypothetical protein [Candidatus Paceibacterota bacterium]